MKRAIGLIVTLAFVLSVPQASFARPCWKKMTSESTASVSVCPAAVKKQQDQLRDAARKNNSGAQSSSGSSSEEFSAEAVRKRVEQFRKDAIKKSAISSDVKKRQEEMLRKIRQEMQLKAQSRSANTTRENIPQQSDVPPAYWELLRGGSPSGAYFNQTY